MEHIEISRRIFDAEQRMLQAKTHEEYLKAKRDFHALWLSQTLRRHY
jgi:hypothetical protein